MKTDGSDDYSIGKQKEYIQETSDTINSIKGKFKTCIDELSILITEITDEQTKTIQEFTIAVAILNESSLDYENFKFI